MARYKSLDTNPQFLSIDLARQLLPGFSPDILIVIVVIGLLFGAAKLPKLARSLGSAKGEFEKGLKDGEAASGKLPKSAEDETKA